MTCLLAGVAVVGAPARARLDTAMSVTNLDLLNQAASSPLPSPAPYVPPSYIHQLRTNDAETLFGSDEIPSVEHIDQLYSGRRYRKSVCRSIWSKYERKIRYMDPKPIDASLDLLLANARRAGLSETDLKKTLATFLKNQNELGNQRYLSIVDFSQRADKKRMFLVDLQSGKVTSYKVANGRGSDPGHTGYARSFSNSPGSHKSSLGCYVAVGETWHHGSALRLHGLSADNDNACSRAILLHPAGYVSSGNTGRSLGCLALSYSGARAVVPKLKGGGLICAYDDHPQAAATARKPVRKYRKTHSRHRRRRRRR